MITDKYAWLENPENEYRCENCPLNQTLSSPCPSIQKDGYFEPCGYQICRVTIID